MELKQFFKNSDLPQKIFWVAVGLAALIIELAAEIAAALIKDVGTLFELAASYLKKANTFFQNQYRAVLVKEITMASYLGQRKSELFTKSRKRQIHEVALGERDKIEE